MILSDTAAERAVLAGICRHGSEAFDGLCSWLTPLRADFGVLDPSPIAAVR